MNLSAIELLQRNFPQEADAALIISPVNRRYYTKMPSSDGALLVTRTDAVLLVDFRYIERARRVSQGCGVILRERLYDQLRELLGARGVKSLAVETERMTVADFPAFRRASRGTASLLVRPRRGHPQPAGGQNSRRTGCDPRGAGDHRPELRRAFEFFAAGCHRASGCQRADSNHAGFRQRGRGV